MIAQHFKNPKPYSISQISSEFPHLVYFQTWRLYSKHIPISSIQPYNRIISQNIKSWQGTTQFRLSAPGPVINPLKMAKSLRRKRHLYLTPFEDKKQSTTTTRNGQTYHTYIYTRRDVTFIKFPSKPPPSHCLFPVFPGTKNGGNVAQRVRAAWIWRNVMSIDNEKVVCYRLFWY